VLFVGVLQTPGNLENFGFMLYMGCCVALRLISFQRFMSKDFPGELPVRGSWSWSFGWWGWGVESGWSWRREVHS